MKRLWRAARKCTPLQTVGGFLLYVSIALLWVGKVTGPMGSSKFGGSLDPSFVPILNLAIPTGLALWLYATWREWKCGDLD